MIKVVDKIQSKTDNVTKYIFELYDGLITEFSYLNKGDGKDIICVSTQTLCAQRCKFCHVTDHIGKLKLRNLQFDEIYVMVEKIISDLNLTEDCLLVSFMGCGEPLNNVDNVMQSMELIEAEFHKDFKVVRFALATMIPHNEWHNFFKLTHYVSSKNLKLKIHLSLHYTDDHTRKEWMPNALPIYQSIDSLNWAVETCGVKGEVHYALIEGVNDSVVDMLILCDTLRDMKINVKFLYYNEKDSVEASAISKANYELLTSMDCFKDIEYEYYKAPGLDVGASCGQFLLDYYEKYNKIS